MNLCRSKPKITLGSFDCEFNLLETVPEFNPSLYFNGKFNLDPFIPYAIIHHFHNFFYPQFRT